MFPVSHSSLTLLRSAILRNVEFHLERARLDGVSYESALNRIYSEGQTAPALVQLRKQALRTVMKTDQQLGLLTAEKLQRLERGQPTVVTKGNPKYLGQITEVDHRISIRGPNGRALYENEVANLQVLPKSLNREKWAHVDEISRAHEAKLDRAYRAGKFANVNRTVSARNGVLLLYTSGNALFADFEAHRIDLMSKLRMGENASLFVGGGAMTAAEVGRWAKIGRLAKPNPCSRNWIFMRIGW